MPAPSVSGGDIEIEIVGGAHLARVVKSLKEVGDGGLRRKLTRDLRRAAAPMVPKVREAIMAIPSQHDGTLRRELAAATRLQMRSTGSQAGIVIRVDGRKMPAGKGSLPAYMEGRKAPWRHPVFGNTDNWVRQSTHAYFYKTVTPMADGVRRVLARTASEIAHEVTR